MSKLSDEQARTIIAPWYGLFNVATRGDVKAIQGQILTADYESCSGYLPGECWGRDTSINSLRARHLVEVRSRAVSACGEGVAVRNPNIGVRSVRAAGSASAPVEDHQEEGAVRIATVPAQ